jgi:hypothetical protein
MPHYGYLSGPPADVKSQEQAAAAFAATRGWPLCGFFFDTAGHNQRLHEREQGRALSLRLVRGDLVVFADLAAFRDLADLNATASWWQRRGVTCAFANPGFVTNEPAGQLALRLLVEVAAWQQCRLSAQKKQVAARLKAENRRLNQWPVEGYGFLRRGRKTIEVFEEQWVILQIDNLRSERPPQSYMQIYCLLQRVRWCERCAAPVLPEGRGHPKKACSDCSSNVRPLRTRTGSPWSKARVERVGRRARAEQPAGAVS